ncbi:hypothetical protein Tco_1462369 [Tanacetum coccineum]
MMKGSDIGIQDKKAKLFNESERFTSTDGESIESYYHRFSKLMNDFKRNKHFPEKIASNLKFLNILQPEWRRHVTIVHQTKDLHENVANQNGLIVVPGIANMNANQNRNGNVVETRAEGDLEEIEEVNANNILMANLQQASTSGTQTDKAPVYDLDGSTELLEPISEPHQVQQNDSNVTSVVSSVEQSGGTVEQHPLSKEKSTVSSLQEEKKKLKSDFKIREDELLDKQIQLENKIKELDNILVKTGQSIQTMHMLSPKPDSFYHTEQIMALGYQNPFYLKQAQQKL